MNKEQIFELYPDVDVNEQGGPDHFNPDAPIVERDPIAVIIKHPTEAKYLLAKWKNADWVGLLTGGIEEGDTLEETVEKELKEETGYTNIKTIRQLDVVSHGLFFHTIKHVNRLAHYHGVFAELGSLEQVEVSEEEKAIADFVWIEESQVRDMLTRDDMKKIWDFYLNN